MDLIKHHTVVRSKIYHFHVKKLYKHIHIRVNARVFSVSRLLHGRMGMRGVGNAELYMYIVSCYRQKYIFFESARNRLI